MVALPEQLFYNTGIATYVWVLTNRKPLERKGKVQMVDATSFWAPMRKSLGDKRREIPREKADEIVKLLRDFEEGEYVKISPTTHFGFRKITVECPLRLNFQARAERIALLEEQRVFQALAQSKRKGDAGAAEEAAGQALQEGIRKLLHDLPDTLFKDRETFQETLKARAEKAWVKLSPPLVKVILSALSERDETAAICRDKDGNPEPDTELRDTESVPLSESIETFFQREVKPHVPNAWIDTSKRDEKDHQVGVIGYEINFNRYFYKYKPPRSLEEIEADIRAIEQDIVQMLSEVTGSRGLTQL